MGFCLSGKLPVAGFFNALSCRGKNLLIPVRMNKLRYCFLPLSMLVFMYYGKYGK